ncbi:NDP-sugar epimerase, includes UDP-GlcNAc-inverting 4,6-dehydratase FlaA1 and capsular polysaccharide biosynthesis protein EpsC [Lachnospiraceae bacterium C10]|nr:NDP-sugar epimerase, includes UDP-GlcNAc-inverting 4,6-dehydratase FlaA1 and capsular polysaccharide biosynthesis protein EpsC [Lachnospiraceae bacterium C10]
MIKMWMTQPDKKLFQRSLLILFFDLLGITFSGFFALWIRFDLSIAKIETKYVEEQRRILPILILTLVAVYFLFRLYHSIWRFASVSELTRIVGAYILLVPVILIERRLFTFDLPRSTYFIAYMFNFLCCIAIRFSYRVFRYYVNRRRSRLLPESDRVMVIGAGSAARELIADIATSEKVRYQVVCIIDDNSRNWGRYLGNIPIVGGREQIPEMVIKHDVQRIIFAIPSINRRERIDILNIAKSTGAHLQIIPGMYQLVNDEVRVSRLRDVEITDLLGRDEVEVNNDDIFAAIHNKVVLVTGGGGSIGSELCRQVAAAGPKQLIIFDIYENNAYAIQQELKRSMPDLNLVTLIGSVRNTNRVNWLLRKYRPEVVYHAAAHKHVPLMEDSPNEAIKNNCLGTYKMARAAAENGVKRFLLISTDKAVNPTNVMGASKRICELVVQMMDRKYPDTTFCAVRFGNVLGSNGSVIPLFKKQIAEGGPVTVTDKNIIRYFMTIPEAVSLVLQASFYANGGEIFVLDMGEPVRIDDMARKMIELSGFTPDVDIEVKYTGLRPGEKLYEELLIDKSTMKRTANQKIFIEDPYPMDDELFLDQLRRLENASKSELERNKIIPIIREVVPTFIPDRDRL